MPVPEIEKESEDIRFSIITVILNDAKGFGRTAESIAAQTFRDFEWIVIDGGSGAAIQSVIGSYRHSIDKFISEKDNGIYDAMMKGARLAKGRWTIFMNAGDSFSNENVLSSVALGPEADMIYGETYFKPFSGAKVLNKYRPLENLWEGIAFSHQSFFCKTDLIRRLGFREHLKIVADYDFYLRALETKASIRGMNFAIANVEGGGVSDRAFYRRTLERFSVVRKRFKDKPVLKYYLGLIFKKAVKDTIAFIHTIKA